MSVLQQGCKTEGCAGRKKASSSSIYSISLRPIGVSSYETSLKDEADRYIP